MSTRGTVARRWFFATLAALLLVLAYQLSMAVPSTEAVRLRNAFLLEPGTPADFAWTPADRPVDFRWEQRPPPSEFAVIDRGILGDEHRAFEGGLLIAAHLLRNAQDLGPIQSNLEETYRRIGEGYGYCADFTDVFLALAHAAGIPARLWAFSFDGFGGHGHAFVEVFDAARGKWLMIDLYNNFYPLTRPGGEPLSALEFRQVLLDPAAPVTMQRISNARLGYDIPAKAVEYYRRGLAEWYLWWGNDVFSYEARPAVRTASKFGRAVEQLVAVATDGYPHFRVLDVTGNAAKIEHMRQVRNILLVNLVLAALLSLAAIVFALQWWRQTRSEASLRTADAPGEAAA